MARFDNLILIFKKGEQKWQTQRICINAKYTIADMFMTLTKANQRQIPLRGQLLKIFRMIGNVPSADRQKKPLDL
jgi:hypothetical protein